MDQRRGDHMRKDPESAARYEEAPRLHGGEVFLMKAWAERKTSPRRS